jgi:hypothetical protein
MKSFFVRNPESFGHDHFTAKFSSPLMRSLRTSLTRSTDDLHGGIHISCLGLLGVKAPRCDGAGARCVAARAKHVPALKTVVNLKG